MTLPHNPLVIAYDTKPYDREFLSAATGVERLHLRFDGFRLEPATASSAEGARAICVFVNDDV
jgi:D-lactate dehydrogenase